jgi:hypothetical protein
VVLKRRRHHDGYAQKAIDAVSALPLEHRNALHIGQVLAAARIALRPAADLLLLDTKEFISHHERTWSTGGFEE